MGIESDGSIDGTKIYDDNGQLMTTVTSVEFSHFANEMPTANIKCFRPTIKSRVNGRVKFNTKDYTRSEKEMLIKQLELELG